MSLRKRARAESDKKEEKRRLSVLSTSATHTHTSALLFIFCSLLLYIRSKKSTVIFHFIIFSSVAISFFVRRLTIALLFPSCAFLPFYKSSPDLTFFFLVHCSPGSRKFLESELISSHQRRKTV